MQRSLEHTYLSTMELQLAGAIVERFSPVSTAVIVKRIQSQVETDDCYIFRYFILTAIFLVTAIFAVFCTVADPLCFDAGAVVALEISASFL